MYLPLDWLKNKDNEKEVRNLITDSGGCLQFGDNSEKIEKRLKELNEVKILEEFKKGTFAM